MEPVTTEFGKLYRSALRTVFPFLSRLLLAGAAAYWVPLTMVVVDGRVSFNWYAYALGAVSIMGLWLVDIFQDLLRCCDG